MDRCSTNLRDHRCQPKLLYPAKFSITIDEERKIFQNKTKFKQYLSQNQLYRRWSKENFNLKRLITPKKTQGINNLRPQKIKSGGKPLHIHNKINKYCSLIFLKVNFLNTPIKTHRLTDWIWNQDPPFYFIQETFLNFKNRYRLWVKEWKTIL